MGGAVTKKFEANQIATVAGTVTEKFAANQIRVSQIFTVADLHVFSKGLIPSKNRCAKRASA
jgi:hypothetical protein